MQHARIAFRNVFRNKRRTFMAMSCIVVGVIAMSVISGFVTNIRNSLYTEFVRGQGQVQIMPQHYLDLGQSNPGIFYLEDWEAIAQKLRADEELGPMIRQMAPMLALTGIAGNAQEGTSRSFRGAGFIPELYNRMQTWDGFGLEVDANPLVLDGTDKNLVIVGNGMAQQLQICGQLDPGTCRDYQLTSEPEGEVDNSIADISSLVEDELSLANSDYAEFAQIDLMASAANGAPNARSVWVQEAVTQARRDQDNAYVAMHLETAQNLLYEDSNYVSHVMVQFHDVASEERGIQRIKEILADEERPVDVLSMSEFNSTFSRIVAMFGVMQIFVSIVVCIIILFMVANTMAIVVMERVNEIGTLRALGQYRSGIRGLFFYEGVLLGVISATAGVIVAFGVVTFINQAGLTWTTPTSTDPVPIRLLFLETPGVVFAIWLSIAVVAIISSVLPAIRAARISIVDALRFV